MTIIWCIVPDRWSVTDRIFCHLPFYPSNNLKNQNFEKLKKAPQDVIIVYKCKNHDHMLYCSIDMVRNRCNCYFSFWANFFPFTSLIAQKIKIFKKWKKRLEISSFYRYPSKIIRWCTVPEIWCATERRKDGQPEKSKLKKNEKNPWRYHHFTIMYQKSWSYAILFLRYGAWRM